MGNEFSNLLTNIQQNERANTLPTYSARNAQMTSNRNRMNQDTVNANETGRELSRLSSLKKDIDELAAKYLPKTNEKQSQDSQVEMSDDIEDANTSRENESFINEQEIEVFICKDCRLICNTGECAKHRQSAHKKYKSDADLFQAVYVRVPKVKNQHLGHRKPNAHRTMRVDEDKNKNNAVYEEEQLNSSSTNEMTPPKHQTLYKCQICSPPNEFKGRYQRDRHRDQYHPDTKKLRIFEKIYKLDDDDNEVTPKSKKYPENIKTFLNNFDIKDFFGRDNGEGGDTGKNSEKNCSFAKTPKSDKKPQQKNEKIDSKSKTPKSLNKLKQIHICTICEYVARSSYQKTKHKLTTHNELGNKCIFKSFYSNTKVTKGKKRDNFETEDQKVDKKQQEDNISQGNKEIKNNSNNEGQKTDSVTINDKRQTEVHQKTFANEDKIDKNSHSKNDQKSDSSRENKNQEQRETSNQSSSKEDQTHSNPKMRNRTKSCGDATCIKRKLDSEYETPAKCRRLSTNKDDKDAGDPKLKKHNTVFQCTGCLTCFTNQDVINAHLDKCTEIDSKRCQKCSLFFNINDLVTHTLRDHNKNSAVLDLIQLVPHFIEDNSLNNTRSEFQDKDSAKSNTLNDETKEKRVDNDKKVQPKVKLYKCNKCDEHFIEKKNFIYHLKKNHHRSVLLTCNSCNCYKFTSLTLLHHYEKHHFTGGLNRDDFNIITADDLYLKKSPTNTAKFYNPRRSCNETVTETAFNAETNTNSKHDNSDYAESSEDEDKMDSLKSDQEDWTPKMRSENLPPAMKTQAHPQRSKIKKIRSVKCKLCSERFNVKDPEKRLVCGKCRFKARIPKKIVTRSPTRDELATIYRCRFCNLNFTKLGPIKTHIKIEAHRPGSEDIIECRKSDCGMKFVRSSYTFHSNVHHERLNLKKEDYNIVILPNYNTSTFMSGTGRPSNFIINELYREKRRRLFYCQKCEKHFLFRRAFVAHMNLNRDSKHSSCTNTPCLTCGLVFSKKSLNLHQKIHHENLNFNSKDDFVIFNSLDEALRQIKRSSDNSKINLHSEKPTNEINAYKNKTGIGSKSEHSTYNLENNNKAFGETVSFSETLDCGKSPNNLQSQNSLQENTNIVTANNNNTNVKMNPVETLQNTSKLVDETEKTTVNRANQQYDEPNTIRDINAITDQDDTTNSENVRSTIVTTIAEIHNEGNINENNEKEDNMNENNVTVTEPQDFLRNIEIVDVRSEIENERSKNADVNQEFLIEDEETRQWWSENISIQQTLSSNDEDLDTIARNSNTENQRNEINSESNEATSNTLVDTQTTFHRLQTNEAFETLHEKENETNHDLHINCASHVSENNFTNSEQREVIRFIGPKVRNEALVKKTAENEMQHGGSTYGSANNAPIPPSNKCEGATIHCTTPMVVINMENMSFNIVEEGIEETDYSQESTPNENDTQNQNGNDVESSCRNATSEIRTEINVSAKKESLVTPSSIAFEASSKETEKNDTRNKDIPNADVSIEILDSDEEDIVDQNTQTQNKEIKQEYSENDIRRYLSSTQDTPTKKNLIDDFLKNVREVSNNIKKKKSVTVDKERVSSFLTFELSDTEDEITNIIIKREPEFINLDSD